MERRHSRAILGNHDLLVMALIEERRLGGERLRAGLVVHAGETVRPAGPGFWTLPLQALWAVRA